MTTSPHVLDHGSTRPGRWLREHRLRFTLWVTLIEGLLVVVHVLRWWTIVPLAVIAIALWWYGGRSSRSYTVRQASWIFAASQLLVLCVPIALTIFKWVAIGVVSILAVVGLLLLFRRKPA